MFRRGAEPPFRDRTDAGRQLGDELAVRLQDVPPDDVLVIGLARGGIAVAAPVAHRLAAQLDVLVVRKLGAPVQPELAIGAIAGNHVRVLNTALIQDLGLSQEMVDRITADADTERIRLETLFREGRPESARRGKTIVLVDDGLATGASMRAAVEDVRTDEPRRIIVAVPVAPRSMIEAFADLAGDAVAVRTPAVFDAVGRWYRDFTPVTSTDVRSLLHPGADRQPSDNSA